MYNAIDVARYVINYSNEKNYNMSNLKLQKVLYFIQAWFLIKRNRACFRDEIQAWDFGPVIPIVYREFKMLGSCNIPRVKTYIVYNDENFWNSKLVEYNDEIISEIDKKEINLIIDTFAKYSATYLVELTLKQKPWIEAHAKGNHSVITKTSIKRYFE